MTDYTALRGLPPEGRAAWISARHPDPPGAQWWLSLADSAETEARWLLRQHRAAGPVFEFADAILGLGVRAGAVPAAQHGYWALRLAASAIEFGVPPDRLPAAVTPDGSAQLALRVMPLTTDRAVSLSRTLEEELARGIDRPADASTRALTDVMLLISWLARVRDAVSDPELRSEIARWEDAAARMDA